MTLVCSDVGDSEDAEHGCAFLTPLSPHILAIPKSLLFKLLLEMCPPRSGANNTHVMIVGRDEREENGKSRTVCGVCLIHDLCLHA